MVDFNWKIEMGFEKRETTTSTTTTTTTGKSEKKEKVKSPTCIDYFNLVTKSAREAEKEKDRGKRFRLFFNITVECLSIASHFESQEKKDFKRTFAKLAMLYGSIAMLYVENEKDDLNRAKFYCHYGCAFCAGGLYDHAIELFEKSIKLDVDNRKHYEKQISVCNSVKLHAELMEKGEKEEADKIAKKLLEKAVKEESERGNQEMLDHLNKMTLKQKEKDGTK